MFCRTNSWELLGSLNTTSEFEFTFNLFRELTFAANSVFSRIHLTILGAPKWNNLLDLVDHVVSQ